MNLLKRIKQLLSRRKKPVVDRIIDSLKGFAGELGESDMIWDSESYGHSFDAELSAIDKILAKIPEENVIDRMSFESRKLKILNEKENENG